MVNHVVCISREDRIHNLVEWHNFHSLPYDESRTNNVPNSVKDKGVANVVNRRYTILSKKLLTISERIRPEKNMYKNLFYLFIIIFRSNKIFI